MDLYDAMSTLRAVRRLRADPIEPATLERVLRAATWAPTGGNNQPFHMLAVQDPAKKQRLAELYAARWQTYAEHGRERMQGAPEDIAEGVRKALEAGDYLSAHMHEVPVIVVFCFNPRHMAITDIDQDRPTVVGGGSVYPAVQNLLLAARNEGLGCVLTTLLCFDEDEVKGLLGIPEGWGTCAHIPLGWPVRGGHGPISRRPVERMVSVDAWGEPWRRVGESS